MNENESELFKFIMAIIDMCSLRRLREGEARESGDKKLVLVRLSPGTQVTPGGPGQLLHPIQCTV